MSRTRRPTSRADLDVRSIYADELQINAGGTVRNLAGLANTWYVAPQSGSDSHDGRSWGTAFASMSPLDALLGHGDTVYLSGVLRQQWTAPYKNDVSIIGVGNTPRQATSGGTANGGGATWLSPATGVDNTLALLKIMLQAWHVENIFFNNAATGAPSILIFRDGETPEADASHATIRGCRFNGTDDGILASGGPNFVRIQDCMFSGFSGSGDTAIKAVVGAGQGVNFGWIIEGCVFYDNVNHILAPLVNGTIRDNNFIVVGNATTATIACSLTGGAKNSVYSNMFNRPTASSPNATLYVGGTSDVWSNNYGTDAIFFDVPDNS